MKHLFMISSRLMIDRSERFILGHYLIDRMEIRRHLHQSAPLPGEIIERASHLVYILSEHRERPDEDDTFRAKLIVQIQSEDDQDTNRHEHIHRKPFGLIPDGIFFEHGVDSSHSLTNSDECAICEPERDDRLYISEKIKQSTHDFVLFVIFFRDHG